jgi:hypothetical protein
MAAHWNPQIPRTLCGDMRGPTDVVARVFRGGFASCVRLVCLVALLCSCQPPRVPEQRCPPVSGMNPSSATPGQPPRVVGAVIGHQRAEQEEVYSLLTTNGIDVSFDGSLLYDIVVPADQAQKALRLLMTNHLFLEGKIYVGEPSPKHHESD